MQSPLQIAVVGMAGIFPGAGDLEQFWNNLIHKKAAVRDVPSHRWAAPARWMVQPEPAPDRARSQRCCLVEDLAFDPEGFAIDADLLAALDPLYHMVLQAGRNAVSRPVSVRLNARRTGTVLAAIALPTESASTLTRKMFHSLFEHQLFGTSSGYRIPSMKERLAARVTSLPASLLAAALSLEGGSLTLDAACASSLYAVKLACDALAAGRVDAMLAGGVSRPDCLYTQVGFSQLRALSPSGRCAPFDREADGLVVGEGAGILVLKRLADALREGDKVYGIIRGIGLSNDMRGNLLAPDTEGQLRAMQTAYRVSGWNPTDVDLIECHGAGTPVGDATELTSLTALWADHQWRPGQCAIGSVKSAIGHLLTAAGAAGMIKTLLAMQAKSLPPSLHFSEAAADSPLVGGPFRVAIEAAPWERRTPDTPRRAAVSAFGFGGINAHLLLEEPPISAEERTAHAQPERVPAMTTTSGGPDAAPIAITGMETIFGAAGSLEAFQDRIFQTAPGLLQRPADRWKGCEALLADVPDLFRLHGGFFESICLPSDMFRIPPRELPEILPQHLVMLQAAAGALIDAAMPLRRERTDMGVIVGLDFDYEATNFQFRWSLYERIDRWCETNGLPLDTEARIRWREALQQAAGPPLTSTRTLGALGGVVASRLAREFRFGGPSFGVSCGRISGLRALEIAVRMLQQQETAAMLVGAVDMAGDLREMLVGMQSYSRGDAIRAFDRESDGTLPGEGAAAVVLKPLDRALKDGDRVYAVIRGVGISGNAQMGTTASGPRIDAITRALAEAQLETSSIDHIEVHGSGVPAEDDAEAHALSSLPVKSGRSRSVGATAPILGDTGCAASLAGLIKTAVCLHQRRIPPLATPRIPVLPAMDFPDRSRPWPQSDPATPPRACLTMGSDDGNAAAVVLEAAKRPDNGTQSRAENIRSDHRPVEGRRLSIPVGGPRLQAVPWKHFAHGQLTTSAAASETAPANAVREYRTEPRPASPALETATGPDETEIPREPNTEVLRRSFEATGAAHRRFLEFSQDLTRNYGEAFALQNQLLQKLRGPRRESGRTASAESPPSQTAPKPAPLYSRDQCLEFATGRVSRVLGPKFADVDRYAARVRLPDEPLMLVDRILTVEGEKGSLSSGRVVTEHDVRPDAWYLDGGRAPVCIAVEAGQADLFLCAYLGIDLAVRGRRVYRLLDASVTFHRTLPRPGETIRYDIRIEKFIRQGDTYMFFFNFRGTIGSELLIRMTDGCAGFFTEAEIRSSGGILGGGGQADARQGRRDPGFRPLVAVRRASYDDQALDALRKGDLAACFGDDFRSVALAEGLRLPGGRMKLIDRILDLEPEGGRSGLGRIRAEADIHGDDWFLTCHFVDDMTMPGTLMYECCAHTLRVFLLRLGWVTDRPEVRYEPISEVKSVLKCRGPVTPKTRKVVYEVEIREIGYRPEPYVIADAHMYADGRYIVRFMDMTLQMVGLDRNMLGTDWAKRNDRSPAPVEPTIRFNRQQILAFAVGRPSEAFGAAYRPFDTDRFIARLPGPPYSFLDRVVGIEPRPWELPAEGWVEAEYDLKPAAWFFRADRSGILPYCVMMEIALQACGWLAAYAGSALRSQRGLRFRNLDGRATLLRDVPPCRATLTTRCRMKKMSASGDMLIESFEFQVLFKNAVIFEGDTSFGFFTREALQAQKGIAAAEGPVELEANQTGMPIGLKDEPPLTPEDPDEKPARGAALPARALRMIDRIDTYLPDGGPHGLGYLRAIKTVDPSEWFFKAHFFQDPVCPGSLGVESFLQLLKFAALQRWPALADSRRFVHRLQKPHTWKYRGQILPHNRRVEVIAAITAIEEGPEPELRADGWLKVDGLTIYHLKDFGIAMAKI
ncbi:MAG TPA: beta-ketoacyl synthase N-terminal-like domain-containing protein [Desulfobacterales bacterium]